MVKKSKIERDVEPRNMPRIGDTVLMQETADDGQVTQSPAVVTAVHDQDCVNLSVMKDGRTALWAVTSVQREGTFEPPEEWAYYGWLTID